MLNLYAGRAHVDRKQFMFSKIAQQEKTKRIVILVPDQFTLEMERQAFFYLGKQALMNVEIMSFSRLGMRIFQETGGSRKTFINDLGKVMLLRKVASDRKASLTVYASQCEKRAFIEMMTDLIQEMKQEDIGPDALEEMLSQRNEDDGQEPLYLKKLRDVQILFSGYEEALRDRYIDMEDSLSLLREKLGQADFLKGAQVWVEGFDTGSKKMYGILEEILKTAESLHMVWIADPLPADEKKAGSGSRDRDLFEMAEKTIQTLTKMGQSLGIPVHRYVIGERFQRTVCEETAHLERNLYAYPFEVFLKNPRQLHIHACSDYYSEAETAADIIMKLVESGTYRLRDIGVVCSDMQNRAGVIKRVFETSGITCFMDEKRSVMHNPFVQFILALPEVSRWGYRHEDVFRLLRTELLDITRDECELLENYVLQYGIRGSLWKKPFEKWDTDDGQDALAALNCTREKVQALFSSFETAVKECRSGGDFTKALYGFLIKEANFADRAEEAVKRLKEQGDYEAAAETAQIWNTVVELLRQMLELTDEVEMDPELYFEMLQAGFETVRLGVIPTTMDQVLVGDLQRTKTGNLKVLFVLGVNDGILPSGGGKPGLFHQGEKEKIEELGLTICKSDRLKQEEEKLGIYKMLSLASDALYLSYTVKDGENGEMKPSLLIDRIKKLFPLLREEKGLHTGGQEEDLCEFKSRINYMLAEKEHSPLLETLRQGASFENDKKLLEPDVFGLLYPELLVMSPTSLETFSRCPFRYFIKFGIRADERRAYQVSAPEMGTLFHKILMRYTEEATAENQWRNMTQEQCVHLIRRILEETVRDFRKGVLFEDNAGKYRISRMQRVCEKTAWMVTEHMNRGRFEEFHFEMAFGRNQLLPPIRIEAENGRIVYIEGRIDRIDVLKSEEEEYMKVIDYKSGNEKVVKKEILSGYKLQLMLYMNAVISGMSRLYPKKRIKPAGVFYFKIQEPVVDAENKEDLEEAALKAFLEQELRKEFKMDGIVVNDLHVIDGLDEAFTGYSQIIRVRKKKDGTVSGTGDFAALSPEEFCRLQEHVAELTKDLCGAFAAGDVSVAPKRGDGDTTACTFCDYHSICMFDRSCTGFHFVR